MAGSRWGSFIHPVTAHFRRKRFAKLLRLAPDFLSTRILDLGGSLHFWQKCGVDIAAHDITLLNIAVDGASTDSEGRIHASKIVLYDGLTIPWPDGHFEWVICNSVIEHVAPAQRARFCAELRRVGRRYIVQTPAFAFPVEPHFVIPFLHWLPRNVARRLAAFGPWAMLGGRTNVEVERYFDEVHLLRRKDLIALSRMPNC